jgi:hypothetical protein
MTNFIFMLMGAVVAGVLAFAFYRMRGRLVALRSQVGEQVAVQRARAARSGEARYREALIELANDQHIAGHLVALEEVAIAPRFFPEPLLLPAEAAGPEGDGDVGGLRVDPLNLIPRVYDCPEFLARYQLEGAPMEQILAEGDGTALLGVPGSGRTVALALMAIRAARGEATDDGSRLPILFHLADADTSPEALGRRRDPGEVLLNAVRHQLKTAPLGPVAELLAAGQCLLLADGWDELPDLLRRQAVTWLRGLQETYPGNKLVVAGPVRGYGPLLALNLVPVYLGPWGDPEYAACAGLWADAWPEMMRVGRELAERPSEDLIHRASVGNTARSPMDAVMRTWAIYIGEAQTGARLGWYDSYARRLNPHLEAQEALQRIARGMLEVTDEVGLSIEEVSDTIDASFSASEKIGMATSDYLVEVTQKTRLMTEHARRRCTFRHPLITAALAAQADSQAEPALPFLALRADIRGQVERHLQQDGDLLHDHLLAPVHWAVDADPKAPWRSALLRQVAQTLLMPGFPLVRERMLALLIASRDPNVGFVFRQGLGTSDKVGRMLCAFGFGAVGDPNTVVDLSAGLSDSEEDVQIATALALGAIGTKAALDSLIEALLTGSERVRRAVAETLATNPGGEGHEVLREALNEEEISDVATRRAAVYGLRRVGEPWVVELLTETVRNDSHWLVRAAANDAIEALGQPGGGVLPPMALPEPAQIDWLAAWASGQGMDIPSGPDGIEMVIRALQNGEEEVRVAAAQTLGMMGRAESIKPLYVMLQDPSPAVRDAAHRALGHIQAALGMPLPAV